MPPKAKAAASAPAAKAKGEPKSKAAAKKEKKEEARPEDLIEKVPEPDYAAFDARMEKVQHDVDKLQNKQQALNKRIQERSGGKDEYTGRRAELRQQIDHWTRQMDTMKEKREEIQKAMGMKKEEGIQAKNDLSKLQKSVGYTSEQEIDGRIADIEFKLWTESVPLKQEKDLLKEIQELKRNRPKVAQVHQLKATIDLDDKGKGLKEQLKETGDQMSYIFQERSKISEQLKALNEERNSKMGDLPDLINEREELGKQIQEKIKERNEIKRERKEAEDLHYKYKQEVRRVKQERAQEDRIKRQKEYDERKRLREADKLDEQPYIQEIALVEQCMAFCKSLIQAKGPVEKEEKKEVKHELKKGEELLVKKEDREEFYFEPTARGKKTKTKAKKDESSSKPIKHNAETFQLFDKLKLDAPITTDDVPALLEKLEAKLVEFNDKVKKWEEQREDLKEKILAGEATADDDKDETKEEAKEEAAKEDKEEEKEEDADEEKEEEKEDDEEEKDED